MADEELEDGQDGETHRTADGRRIVVGAAIVRRGRLLAARRIEPPEFAGGWELPGGKVEPGESEVVALAREIAEELGIPARIGARLPGEWPLGEAYLLRVYAVTLADDVEPMPVEQHDALRWVTAVESVGVGWLAGDVAPVRAAVEALL